MIIAIDPGGTTGVALRLDDGTFQTCTVVRPEELWDMLASPALKVIAYETFEPRAARISKYGLHTVRLCGGIEAVGHLWHLKVVKQYPVTRMPFQRDAAQLLRGREHVVHEEDALAHLLAYEYYEKQHRGKRG